MSQVGWKRRTQSGTSLLEVLIVMVILLLGIFAVVRVFPLGFQYMKNAERRTLGVRIAQQELERLRNDDENLPASISFSFYDGVIRKTVAGFSPDYDLLSEVDKSSALDNAGSYYSDLNLYRYVSGERVKVPMPTVVGGVSGSIYTVKLGPIYLDPSFGDPATAPAGSEAFLKVTGAPMNGLSGESNDGSTNPNTFNGFLRTVNNYVIDYGGENGQAFLLVPRADHDRKLVVSYTREVTSNDATVSVQDQVVPVAANTFAWVAIPGATDIVPGSETVKQEFERLPGATNFDPDNPYQYKLVHRNIDDGTGTLTFANIGMIAFNPFGASFNEGGQAFSAYVDYAVLDWHIIRDDREVPSVTQGAAGDVPVRLTLSKIKLAGDDNLDGSLYEGVFPSASGAENSDIVVVRLDTGATLTRGDYANRATTDAGAGFWVNNEGRDNTYGTGTIYLNTNVVAKGVPIRVMYKAEGEWGVSLQKAAADYKFVTGAHPPLTPTDHDSDPTTDMLPLGDSAAFSIMPASLLPDPTGAMLVFNQSELNKSVTGVFEYYRLDNPGDDPDNAASPSTLVRVPSTQITLSPAGGLDPSMDTTDSNGAVVSWDFVKVDVARYMPARHRAKSWRVIGTLKGVSVKSRAIWKDEVNKKARWRVQDLDSYLTQGAQQ